MSEWQPIKTAPHDRPIRARIEGHGDEHVIALIEGFLNSAGDHVSAWAHLVGVEPPCWTDGVCWEVNAGGVASARPTHWKPYAP